MKAIIKLFKKFRHLVLYGIIGSFSSGLDFCIYTFLVQVAGLQYLLANCISVFGGITTSFILNRNYNFKVKDHSKRRFSIFLTVGLCGLLMSNIILYLCIDVILLDKLMSKLLSIVLVVFFQFLVNKYLTFKPTNEETIVPIYVNRIKNIIMDKVYFVMPAYNEAENIEETIKQWYPVVEKLSGGG